MWRYRDAKFHCNGGAGYIPSDIPSDISSDSLTVPCLASDRLSPCRFQAVGSYSITARHACHTLRHSAT